MDIVQIRRARLKEWFSNRSLGEEKSYLSQLINGKASFGEKAARRLEKQYNMPPDYLDRPMTDRAQDKKIVSLHKRTELPPALAELLIIAQRMNDDGRAELLKLARMMAPHYQAAKANPARS